MGIFAVNQSQADRITESVRFTESYQDRIKRDIGTTPISRPSDKSVHPVRVILMQDCYANRDALAREIYRDDKNFCTIVSLVGELNPADRTSTFKLQLFGISLDGSATLIGTSGLIKAVSSINDLYDPLSSIDPANPISPENTWITLGNPYYDDELISYGSVVPASDVTADELTTHIPASSPIAMWAIQFDQTLYGHRGVDKRDSNGPTYSSLELRAFLDDETRLSGLLGIVVAQSPDLISSSTTVVTDIYGRTPQYPWQAGTIAVCLDFADIGFGIIGNAPRNFNSVVPLQ